MNIYKILIKFLLCISLFLIVSIMCRYNYKFREMVYDNVFQNNIDYFYFKDIYNKYLGGIFPISNNVVHRSRYVSFESLYYSDAVKYLDGVKLMVGNNYLIPSLDNGVVVFVGKKDGYGSVVIVENDSGVNVWYGNVCNVMVRLYDSLDEGNYIGDACDKYIYLVYSDGNKFLDYNDYLK